MSDNLFAANLIAALEMAKAGIPVFPMHVLKDDSGKWQKKPAIKGWRTEATTDVRIIERWHRDFPRAVFAIELEKAGLLVIDCDRHREDADGCAAFKELVEANGIPLVPMTRTSGFGWHVFFRQPKMPIGCPVKTKLPPGVEVKGAGGNIVVPGSRRPDGQDWHPITGQDRPTLPHAYSNRLDVMPPWLEMLARKVEPESEPQPQPQPQRKSSRRSSDMRERAYAKAALDGQCQEIAELPANSGRNKALNAAAFVLGRMVNREWIDVSEVKAALLDAARRCGLVKDEGVEAVQATIASGLKAGLKQPHDDLKDKEPPRSRSKPNGQEDGPEEDSARPGPMSEADVEKEICRLAALTEIQYARQRDDAHKRLGLPAGVLDKLVNAERRKSNDNGKQGRALSLPEPEPWSERVNGVKLLDDLAVIISQHAVMSDREVDTLALWVLHTYLLAATDVTPRLAITSPEKGCGKTRVLEILELLVWRPLLSANATPAAIFRTVEKARPTLLIDEADTFLRPENDELRGILNSGHKRGGAVLRTVGDDSEPRQFATFAPAAIAGIGELPDTISNRSIAIKLRRARPEETATIAQLRHGKTERFAELARKVRRWTDDNAERVRNIDPIMPDGVFNRSADNWRPLIAIADAAGGDWPGSARRACTEAVARADEQSIKALLLADIRATFTEQCTDRLPSAELVNMLVGLEGHPWADWKGKPITTNGLARLLKPFGIYPVKRTYQLFQFDDAFERYLAKKGA